MQVLSIVAVTSVPSHRIYHINDTCFTVSLGAYHPEVTLLTPPSQPAVCRGSEETQSYADTHDCDVLRIYLRLRNVDFRGRNKVRIVLL